MNAHDFTDGQVERSIKGTTPILTQQPNPIVRQYIADAAEAQERFGDDELERYAAEQKQRPIKLVQTTAGKMTVRIFDGADPHAQMAVRFEQTGVNSNPKHRAELQGVPIYHGLLGPMWDGDCIRYEDQETYNTLST